MTRKPACFSSIKQATEYTEYVPVRRLPLLQAGRFMRIQCHLLYGRNPMCDSTSRVVRFISVPRLLLCFAACVSLEVTLEPI